MWNAVYNTVLTGWAYLLIRQMLYMNICLFYWCRCIFAFRAGKRDPVTRGHWRHMSSHMLTPGVKWKCPLTIGSFMMGNIYLSSSTLTLIWTWQTVLWNRCKTSKTNIDKQPLRPAIKKYDWNTKVKLLSMWSCCQSEAAGHDAAFTLYHIYHIDGNLTCCLCRSA